jgi:hypothetical protein
MQSLTKSTVTAAEDCVAIRRRANASINYTSCLNDGTSPTSRRRAWRLTCSVCTRNRRIRSDIPTEHPETSIRLRGLHMDLRRTMSMRHKLELRLSSRYPGFVPHSSNCKDKGRRTPLPRALPSPMIPVAGQTSANSAGWLKRFRLACGTVVSTRYPGADVRCATEDFQVDFNQHNALEVCAVADTTVDWRADFCVTEFREDPMILRAVGRHEADGRPFLFFSLTDLLAVRTNSYLGQLDRNYPRVTARSRRFVWLNAQASIGEITAIDRLIVGKRPTGICTVTTVTGLETYQCFDKPRQHQQPICHRPAPLHTAAM